MRHIPILAMLAAGLALSGPTACAPKAAGGQSSAVGAATAPLPAGATSGVTFVQYVDPTENSFAVLAPQGWKTQGGEQRVSPISTQPWVTSVAPDGSIQVFIGDASLPGFRVPQGGQSEGQQVASPSPILPPALTLNYRAGADFAAYYGPKRLAELGCAGAAVTGAAQQQPDISTFQAGRTAALAQGLNLNGGYVAPEQDAGLQGFTCTIRGKTMSAGVIADTNPPSGGGAWFAPIVAGYVVPVGQEAWGLAIVKKMLLSRQWNPQWDQATRQATQDALNQQSQYDARINQQVIDASWASTNAILAAGQQAEAQRTAAHNAFMNQMAQQSATRNANFAAYEAQRDLNTWNFNAQVVRGGALYQNKSTGNIFEVDPPQ